MAIRLVDGLQPNQLSPGIGRRVSGIETPGWKRHVPTLVWLPASNQGPSPPVAEALDHSGGRTTHCHCRGMADDVRMKTELSRTLFDVDRGPVKDAILDSLNLMDNAPRGRVAEAPFSIAPAGVWEISDDGLEWDDEWDLYVVPTSRVDDVCGPQMSITLSADCDRLGGEPCTSAELEFFIRPALKP